MTLNCRLFGVIGVDARRTKKGGVLFGFLTYLPLKGRQMTHDYMVTLKGVPRK